MYVLSFILEWVAFANLFQNEIAIVQAALLGSILANLLLILGMCFLIGGLRFREQVRKVIIPFRHIIY
jgi:Ca2+:H+ antiporter